MNAAMPLKSVKAALAWYLIRLILMILLMPMAVVALPNLTPFPESLITESLGLQPGTLNLGLEAGWFTEFNRIKHALSKIVDIEVVGSWYNADIDLEEMSFDYRRPDGAVLQLFFEEDDPIRQLSGGALRTALFERLKTNTERPWRESNQSQ